MLKIILSLGLLALACGPLRAAEQVSAQTLIKNGKTVLAAGETTSALSYFRKAADTGNAEAALLAGDLLFSQASQSAGRDRVEESLESGYYLFAAATNRQARACADLSREFRDGMGVRTNLIYAYAWLGFAAHLDPAYRSDMDALVLRLDPGDIEKAQACAKNMEKGTWPDFNFQRVVADDVRLRVQGVAVGPHGPLVILNGNTFARGESGNVLVANAQRTTYAPRINVTCVDIGSDYVLLAVGGEPTLRLLSMPASTRL